MSTSSQKTVSSEGVITSSDKDTSGDDVGATRAEESSPADLNGEMGVIKSTLNGAAMEILGAGAWPYQAQVELFDRFQEFLNEVRHQNGAWPYQAQGEFSESLQKFATKTRRQNTGLTDQNQQLIVENQQLAGQVQALKQQINLLENTGPTFSRFSRFPPELRNLIWKLASNVPRLIRLQLIPSSSAPPSVRFHSYPSNVPAVLHACQESRKQALKSYHRIRENGVSGISRYLNEVSDVMWFNSYAPPSEDRNRLDYIEFKFDSHWARNYLGHIWFQSAIRQLAFNIVDVCESSDDQKQPFKDSFILGLGQFPNLKEVILVDGVQSLSPPCPKGIRLITPDEMALVEDCYKPITDAREFEYIFGYEDWANAYLKEELDPKVGQNPWLKNGRVPPRIKIMKTIDTASISELRWDNPEWNDPSFVPAPPRPWV